MPKLTALILAAGKGTRMKSTTPKVLHTLCGQPMIAHVTQALKNTQVRSLCFVIGHSSEMVKLFLKDYHPHSRFVKQTSLNGSGGAARQAKAWLKQIKGDVIVTCGDTPLISGATLKALVRSHRKQKNQATVLTTHMSNPRGYGRIVRLRDGSVLKIVEELDADLREKKIHEINVGTYVFSAAWLRSALSKLNNKNAKREYYLTDTLEIIRRRGGRVGGFICEDERESLGINSRQDLARAHQICYQKKAEALMQAGVTIVDPNSTYIDPTVKIGADTIIWPQTYLLGQTQIGPRSEIGPWTHIYNSRVENSVKIQSSFVDRATIRKYSRVGPYSRVRPNSKVGPRAVLGNFSEVKNSTLKPGSKVNHLSYIGDAKLGKNVNIGAGTITCNYDGIRKFPTVIQDHAFIGSNTNLVAPIKIGAHAVVGAGSSLSQNVPPWSLVVERGPLRKKVGWARTKFKKKKK